MSKYNQNKSVVIFEEYPVRRQWDEKKEKWYFSVVDIIAILTQSPNPNNYWKVLKNRLKNEGSQLVTNCNQLCSGKTLFRQKLCSGTVSSQGTVPRRGEVKY